MNVTDTHYFGYRSALAQNRDLFLLKFHNVVCDFLTLDSYFEPLHNLTIKPKKNGKNNSGFIPFMILMRRQTINAFEALATAQSYQSWVMFRPAIEATLIMGKFMDDPLYAKYWKQRSEYHNEFHKHFEGKGLVSDHLPKSKDIQLVLKKINDEFMHLNSDYVWRFTKIHDADTNMVKIATDYVDSDEDQAAHLYAFLHLALILIDSLFSMLNADIMEPVDINVKLKGFEEAYAPLVSKLCQDHPDKKSILKGFGLWEIA